VSLDFATSAKEGLGGNVEASRRASERGRWQEAIGWKGGPRTLADWSHIDRTAIAENTRRCLMTARGRSRLYCNGVGGVVYSCIVQVAGDRSSSTACVMSIVGVRWTERSDQCSA
jgi:hypothetical protein